MSAAPITDGPAPVLAGDDEFDPVLGTWTFHFVIPRHESVYFRLVIESWEDFAVARTMEPVHQGDRTRSLVVVMAVPDFVEPCRAALARLRDDVGAVQVATTPAMRAALRRDLLD